MRSVLLLLVALAGLASTAPTPPRQMEPLGRGLVALHAEAGKVSLSWRLLGTEPDGIAFHVYRRTGDADPVRLTTDPLIKGTCFTDAKADLSRPTTYFVRPVRDGKELSASAAFKFPANPPVRPYLPRRPRP